MKQAGLLRSWTPCSSFPSSFPLPLSPPSFLRICSKKYVISATVCSIDGNNLTAKERRQLRNERRESKATNWKEDVEERLLKKPKKRYASWTEELNLDKLALLGTQWWVVRVSRVSGQATAERLAKLLVRNFPEMDFQVYLPSVHVKMKLKNGSYSDKSKPLFPGCLFFRCVLNKDIHDFVREVDGVGGFLGSKVGNTKRQINRPKHVPMVDMEAIFRQAKEEQEKADKEFEEEQRAAGVFDIGEANTSVESDFRTMNLEKDAKPKRRMRKGSASSESAALMELVPGSSVRVLSGSFADFTGCLRELDHNNSKATVGFMLFGKETLADLDISQIVAETT